MSAEQELKSIMRFFHERFSVAELHTGRLKQGFKEPCLYFPYPFSFDSPDTLSTFMVSYSMQVKLFHHSDEEANQKAEKIADDIRRQRNLIPLYSKVGNFAGAFVRINRVEVRETDNGVCGITLTWDSRYHYDREEFEKMGELFLNTEVK